MVSARRFRQAFTNQWNHDREHNMQALLDAYPDAAARWTAYMQKADDAFLRRLATHLQRDVRIEWYNLDAIYFDPTNNPVTGSRGGTWPSGPA